MSSWLIAWIVVMILSIIAELCTFALVSIWFAVGAAAAAVMAAFDLPVWSQILVFAVVSAALLLLLYRKLSRRHTEKTNAASLIGRRCVVSEEIDNLKETGRVQVDGLSWSAKSAREDTVIKKDAVVEIRGIRGVHLICEEVPAEIQ